MWDVVIGMVLGAVMMFGMIIVWGMLDEREEERARAEWRKLREGLDKEG